MDRDLERALREAAAGRADPDALRAAVAERAGREGLLDVAYDELDSPLGTLVAAATPRGLVMLAYAGGGDDPLALVARRVSPRVLRAPGRLDPVRRELDAYFAGRLRRFETPVDWTPVRGFTRRVLQRTAAIPFGRTATYAEVAAAAGSPRAHRAAGNALGSNLIPIVVPCHRVLRSGGALGGYTGGLDRKRFLLDLERSAS